MPFEGSAATPTAAKIPVASAPATPIAPSLMVVLTFGKAILLSSDRGI